MHLSVPCTMIYASQDTEATKACIISLLDKEEVILYIHNGV